MQYALYISILETTVCGHNSVASFFGAAGQKRDPIGSSLVGSRTDGPQQPGSLEGTLTTYLVHGSDLGFGRPQHFYGEGRSLAAAAAASGAALIAVTWLPAAYSLT